MSVHDIGDASLLGYFFKTVAANGANRGLIYFDRVYSYEEMDSVSDALAAAFQADGVQAGDRIMVALQNVPAFVLTLLASLKLGAILVTVNPMYRAREIEALISDSMPSLVICHDEIAADVLTLVTTRLPTIVSVSPFEGQSRNDARCLPSAGPALSPNAIAFGEFIGPFGGKKPVSHRGKADEVVLIVYTSGTTGSPKGVMISNANICAGGRFYVEEAALGSGPVLGIAPLFHVTGLSGHIAGAIMAGSPLILNYRFHPEVVLEEIASCKPEFTVGAITALSVLAENARASIDLFSSFKVIMSGGAPIAPTLKARFRERTGIEIRNVYGLTETTAPITAVPSGLVTPVDERSGALSVGMAIRNASISIVDDAGNACPPGEAGEITVRGPSVSKGYWRNAAATAESFTDFGFKTGDIGIIDEDGWLFIVDRKKDMIIASGFKVWPREIEDVLYTHPAISEAAVIGIPDAHRGETVKAIVSLRKGGSVTQTELIDFCKARLAAYKYPRVVEIVESLPKTVTGKILKRELR